jgi:hypothetical protein
MQAAVANDVTGTEYDDGDTLCEQEVQDMARDIQGANPWLHGSTGTL